MSARKWEQLANEAIADAASWKVRARTLEIALRECNTDISVIADSSRSRLELRLQAINTIVQTAVWVKS